MRDLKLRGCSLIFNNIKEVITELLGIPTEKKILVSKNKEVVWIDPTSEKYNDTTQLILSNKINKIKFIDKKEFQELNLNATDISLNQIKYKDDNVYLQYYDGDNYIIIETYSEQEMKDEFDKNISNDAVGYIHFFKTEIPGEHTLLDGDYQLSDEEFQILMENMVTYSYTKGVNYIPVDDEGIKCTFMCGQTVDYDSNIFYIKSIDFSHFNSDSIIQCYGMFAWSTAQTINLSNFNFLNCNDLYFMFFTSQWLQTLILTNCDFSTCPWNVLFYANYTLTNIIGPVYGIHQSEGYSLEFKWPNLTKDSIMVIINGLMELDYPQTLEISEEIYNQLTEEQISIATNKNWTILY